MPHAPAASPPEFLAKTSSQFFRSAIERRVKIQDLFAGPLSDIVRRELVTFTARPDLAPHVAWVGGSRSWDAWIHSDPYFAPVLPTLTPKERVAVRSGNWDVFFACPSLDDAKRLACEVFKVAAAITDKLNKDPVLREEFKFSLTPYGVKGKPGTCKPDAEPPVGESFPGYAFLIEMCKYKARPSAAIANASVPVPICGTNDTTLLCYLEIFPFAGMNLAAFAAAYLASYPGTPQLAGLNYLKHEGLFLFNQLIEAPRVDKGFNVDERRLAVFFKIADRCGWDRAHIYKHTADTYEAIFGASAERNDAATLMHIQSIYQRIPQAAEMVEFFDKWLMEKLRAAINAGVAVLHEKIAAAYPLKATSGAFAMIVGGDAMRRYKSGISVTKDIDVKVYHYGLSKTAQAALAALVKGVVARLVFTLSADRARIFGGRPGEESLNLFDPPQMSMRFLNVSTDAGKNENAQFRFRYIEQSDTFPVDLFSVDYRAHLTARVGEERRKVNHEVAVLDVVIQALPKPASVAAVTAMFGMRDGVPVATSAWLLKDLKQTYEKKELAAARFWGKKRAKDGARFEALRDVVYGHATGPSPPGSGSPVRGHPKIPRGNLDRVDPVVAGYLRRAAGAGDAPWKWYEQAADGIVTRNRRRRIYKHKMPFDWTTLPLYQKQEAARPFGSPVSAEDMDLDGGAPRPPRRRNTRWSVDSF